MAGLRVLYGYPVFPSAAYGDLEKLVAAYLDRLRAAGIDVEGFCLTLNPPAPCLSWRELDRRYRRGDLELFAHYERLEKALEGRDVLLNSTGINLHPRFVETLPVLTAFQCFDDPESSFNLSRPVVRAYDLCLAGNIAVLDDYRAWGAKRVAWSPLGFTPDVWDPGLTERHILEENRDIDLFMMIDRLSPWRQGRMDALARAFPDGHFYGKGWPRGYLPAGRQVEFLRRARIGPNVHNSSGPINYRTFYLPANGVMQICDNKSHLGRIFELGREVVGFDTIKECVDLCRYYLAHEDERKAIALSGFRRAARDYNEIAVFRRWMAEAEDMLATSGMPARNGPGAAVLRERSAGNAGLLGPRLLLEEPGYQVARVFRKVKTWSFQARDRREGRAVP